MAWLKLVLAVSLVSNCGLWYGHQSGNPVSHNVHGGSGVVDIRQDVGRFTASFSLFNNRSVPHGLGGNAIGEDENQRDDIHHCEDRDRCILNVDIHLPALGHSNQHPTDAELDWDDGGTISHFEDKEELLAVCLILFVSGLT